MIFVTGGTGMLGSYLLWVLCKEGKEVKASKREGSSTKFVEKLFRDFNSEHLLEQIEWVNTDLFSLENITENLKGSSRVYHCAAMISASPSKREEMIWNNSKISENVVNACLNAEVDKLCFVSSIAALGEDTFDGYITEKSIWKESENNSSYSVSKYFSELEAWRGITEGLKTVIINPSVILGAGDWEKGSPNLIKTLDDGLKYYTHGSSGFVYAMDVAKIMFLLMQDDKFINQNYLVSAENIPYRSLFSNIAKNIQVKEPYKYANAFLTALAWRLEWVKSKLSKKDPLITKESARTAHKQRTYSANKLLNDLDFTFTPIDEAVKQICKQYRDAKLT